SGAGPTSAPTSSPPIAPPLAAPAATAPESAPAREAAVDEDPAQKTLEEIQEIHLRDSFWTVS
ncbi:MAG: hypothetical protein AAFX50_07135, partial [Acidobacteriota bacterium]